MGAAVPLDTVISAGAAMGVAAGAVPRAGASARRATDRPLLALGLMLLSALSFSAMAIFVKRLSPDIPQFELVFFRSFINFLIVALLMLARGEKFSPPGKPLLIFRGLAGFIGITCLYYGIGHLPLSVASLLSWSSPLFVILFSRIFLKEKGARGLLRWLPLAFAGLILVLRPDLHLEDTALPLAAVAIALAGAASSGLAYVAVRAATARVGVNAIVFYFTLVSTVISGALALAGNMTVPESSVLWQLILLGIFATAGQLAMTQAYRYAAAGLVSTMSLSNVAFGALFGWVLFGEGLSPIQWAGVILLGFAIGAVSLNAGNHSRS